MRPRVRIRGLFICTKCGDVRESLDWTVEPHGEIVADDVCSCGGDIYDAVECAYCGKIVSEDDACRDEDGDPACEDCYERYCEELEEAV